MDRWMCEETYWQCFTPRVPLLASLVASRTDSEARQIHHHHHHHHHHNIFITKLTVQTVYMRIEEQKQRAS